MSSPTPVPPLTYEQAGVNYDLIDPLKIAAQRAASIYIIEFIPPE